MLLESWLASGEIVLNKLVAWLTNRHSDKRTLIARRPT